MEKPAFGTWCHVEIGSEDIERTKKFYSECFGWSFQDVPQLNYCLYQTGEGGIGGGVMKKVPEMPNHLLNYVFVEDVEAAAQRVENNGGKVLMGKSEVPNTGWFSIVADPDGNVFGLWQGAG